MEKRQEKSRMKGKLLLVDSCHEDLVSCHSDSAEALVVRHVTSRKEDIKVCGSRILKF